LINVNFLFDHLCVIFSGPTRIILKFLWMTRTMRKL